MLVKKKIVRTYTVEMTEDQAKDLITALAKMPPHTDRGYLDFTVDKEGVTVLSDLRESLLNG